MKYISHEVHEWIRVRHLWIQCPRAWPAGIQSRRNLGLRKVQQTLPKCKPVAIASMISRFTERKCSRTDGGPVGERKHARGTKRQMTLQVATVRPRMKSQRHRKNAAIARIINSVVRVNIRTECQWSPAGAANGPATSAPSLWVSVFPTTCSMILAECAVVGTLVQNTTLVRFSWLLRLCNFCCGAPLDIWGAQQLRTGCLSILMFLAPLAEVTP